MKRSIYERFVECHEENPEIFEMFTKLTFIVIKARQYFGARCVWERIRWNTGIKQKNSTLKLNDHYIAHYARLFMKTYPEHDGFYKLRKLRA